MLKLKYFLQGLTYPLSTDKSKMDNSKKKKTPQYIWLKCIQLYLCTTIALYTRQFSV